MTRDLDIVLLGATGFTGSLTARYFAEHAPAELRWGMAGRNMAKLEAIRDGLGVDVDLIEVEVTSAADLRAVAERTRVLVSTVGPYLEHGAPVVAACAAAGTDYLDLTGEPEFVDQMFLDHHATALATGARLVHACGFDSVPHDLGVLFTVDMLGEEVGADLGEVSIDGVVRASAGMSGGTFASALDQFARARSMQRTAARRRKADPREPGRSIRSGARLQRDEELGCWLVPLPTIDPVIVTRSASTLPAYGRSFRYGHYAGVRSVKTIAIAGAGLGGMALAAQIAPLRNLLKKRLPQGDGPSTKQRERAWFSVDFLASANGHRVHTRVSGGDPGYGETAKMLAESAMCIALDDNPPTSGQVTTAVAMGENLLARLQAAGIVFERVS